MNAATMNSPASARGVRNASSSQTGLDCHRRRWSLRSRLLAGRRATGYRDEGMTAYSRLQQREFELLREGRFTAVKHQAFVGTGYFDEVAKTVSAGETSTAALKDSTEERHF